MKELASKQRVLGERIEQRIHFLRGQRVMLRCDLAPWYCVPGMRPVPINIAIRRALVRALLATHEDLRCKIEQLEKRYDAKFSAVFAPQADAGSAKFLSKKQIGFDAEPGIQKMPR
jgi:hypothetical protein